MKQTLVLDNGSYNVKAGFAGEAPVTVHSALAKAKDGIIYVGNDIFARPNLHLGVQFKRPHDQGHLTLWETERTVWDYTFDHVDPNGALDPLDILLLLTETPFQLPQLLMNTDLIVFEEYGFSEYYRCTAQLLVPWAQKAPPTDFELVIDCGSNATWVVPVLYQNPLWRATRKLPIGGRHLNGLLKEMISFRHYEVDEPILINTIKEQTMFVASNYLETLKKKTQHTLEFVLPDFKTTATGFVRTKESNVPEDAQMLSLLDERFTIPELFFHPEIMLDRTMADLGAIQNANYRNLTALVVDSIMACPEVVRPILLANVNIVGGTSQIKNFGSRLISDLECELPLDWTVQLREQKHKIEEVPWYGGAALSGEDIFGDIVISKQEYFEHGANWCQKQFGFKNY